MPKRMPKRIALAPGLAKYTTYRLAQQTSLLKERRKAREELASAKAKRGGCGTPWPRLRGRLARLEFAAKILQLIVGPVCCLSLRSALGILFGPTSLVEFGNVSDTGVRKMQVW